jgi:putative phosphoesterase
MKKILLLSDTHSYIDKQMLKHIKQADEVWHAGDIGDIKVTDAIQKHTVLRAVYGNIDDVTVRKSFPLDAKFTIEEVTVWMTHIGGYPNRYDIRIREQIKRNPPKLFISGHSHILKVIFDKKLN